MQPKPDTAPSCFGMVLPHATIPTCKKCNHLNACRVHAKQTMSELSQIMDLTDLAKHYADLGDLPEPQQAYMVPREAPYDLGKVELSDAQLDLVGRVPAKVAELLVPAFRAGLDIRGALKRGVNPYADKSPAYLRIVFAALMQGPVSRPALTQVIKNGLPNLSDRVASNYASTAYGYLNALQLITSDGCGPGEFRLKEVIQ